MAFEAAKKGYCKPMNSSRSNPNTRANSRKKRQEKTPRKDNDYRNEDGIGNGNDSGKSSVKTSGTSTQKDSGRGFHNNSGADKAVKVGKQQPFKANDRNHSRRTPLKPEENAKFRSGNHTQNKNHSNPYALPGTSKLERKEGAEGAEGAEGGRTPTRRGHGNRTKSGLQKNEKSRRKFDGPSSARPSKFSQRKDAGNRQADRRSGGQPYAHQGNGDRRNDDQRTGDQRNNGQRYSERLAGNTNSSRSDFHRPAKAGDRKFAKARRTKPGNKENRGRPQRTSSERPTSTSSSFSKRTPPSKGLKSSNVSREKSEKRTVPGARDSRFGASKKPAPKFSFEHCQIKEKCGSCIFVNDPYIKGLKNKFEAAKRLVLDSTAFAKCKIIGVTESPQKLAYRTHSKLVVKANPNYKPSTPSDELFARNTDIEKGYANKVTTQNENQTLTTLENEETPIRNGRSFIRSSENGTSEKPSWNRETDSSVVIGLYQPGSHEVVDLSFCPVHAPIIGKTIRTLARLITDLEITPYDEEKGTGDLRYITMRSNHVTEEVMITFVVTRDIKSELTKLVRLLKRDEEKNVASAYMNINASSGNAVYGETTVKLTSSEKLRERICDLDFEVSPTAFFQINPWQASQLYRRVEQLAGYGNGAAAWDMYTGCGQIAMILARSGFKVAAVEENPASIKDATSNARRNGLDEDISFICGRVEDKTGSVPADLNAPKVIVCNPSRRGIAPEARDFLKTVFKKEKSLFIYVSCELSTLIRDVEDLVTSGHKVRQIEAFDMFSQTDKLEWVAVLSP